MIMYLMIFIGLVIFDIIAISYFIVIYNRKWNAKKGQIKGIDIS